MEDHKAMAETSSNEPETPDVVQHHDPRSLPSRSEPDGLEHHPVVKLQNCSYSDQSDPDASFNRAMMMIFFSILCYTLLNLLIFDYLLPPDMSSGGYFIAAPQQFDLSRNG